MTLQHRHDDLGVIEKLVRDADLEIIPFTSAIGKLELVPTGATVTVTTSAKLGLERTLEFSLAAARAGYRVVPHLAARQLSNLAELKRFVGRLGQAGISDLYVVGGDAPDPVGVYNSAGDVLDALAEFPHSLTSIGVACYPEGHPTIADATLSAALHRVQPHADYMVSQMCFNATAITQWLAATRADGISMPLHLGLAAPMQVRKLAELSLRIGVGSSLRYLTKQHGFLSKALRGSSYRPEQLLYELVPTLADPRSAIDQVHLFTFNQVGASVAWQARVGGPTPS